MSDCYVLRDGLALHAPGGVFIPSEQTLIVADVHAGYTATLRSRGYGVPNGDDIGLVERIESLLAATRPERVVIAGDIAHGAAAAHGDQRSALARLLSLFGDREVVVVLGNHDRRVQSWLSEQRVRIAVEFSVGCHRVHHGDDVDRVRTLREEAIAQGGRVIVGHLHPAVFVAGRAGVGALVPAFVTFDGLLGVPALSPYARGVDVRTERMRREFASIVGKRPAGIAAVIGQSVVPFGVLQPGLP